MGQEEIPIIGPIIGGGAITVVAVAATVADKFLNVFGINPDGKWWWERLGTPAKGKFTVEDGHEVYVRPEFPAAIKPEKKRYTVKEERRVLSVNSSRVYPRPTQKTQGEPPKVWPRGGYPRVQYTEPYPVDDIHV